MVMSQDCMLCCWFIRSIFDYLVAHCNMAMVLVLLALRVLVFYLYLVIHLYLLFPVQQLALYFGSSNSLISYALSDTTIVILINS